jgi:quinol monooxygenase YgiN
MEGPSATEKPTEKMEEPSATEKPTEKMEEPSATEKPTEDIEARFRAQHAELLAAAGCGQIVVEKNVIEVSIVKHLTHRETAIPDCWEGLSVAVGYRRLCSDDQDYTDLMIRKMAGAEPHHDPQYVAQFEKAYESELRALRGITLLRLARFTEKVVLYVIVSDWENAAKLEEKLQEQFAAAFDGGCIVRGGGFFEGHQVSVVRDVYQKLIRGEEYLDQLLVGSRAGGRGMTAGLILKDDETVYMLQCAHGYTNIGKLSLLINRSRC